jgi:alkylphenol/PAH-inducible cytochrome P450 monooxygenase
LRSLPSDLVTDLSIKKLAQKWKDEVISADPSGEPMFNVHKWLSRTTMDAIGQGMLLSFQMRTNAYSYIAGFDFDFGALDNIENPLSKVYDNLLYAFFYQMLASA